jgi:PAS domain-containing protein
VGRRAARERGEASLLIENSHDIIYTLTADAVFTFVSPAWTTLLGHVPAQVVGQPMQRFVHPDDRAPCSNTSAPWPDMATGEEGVEYRIKDLYGPGSGTPRRGCLEGPGRHSRWLRGNRQGHHRPEGGRGGVERFRIGFEQGAVGQSLTSLDGRFIQVNDALAEMLGYSKTSSVACGSTT